MKYLLALTAITMLLVQSGPATAADGDAKETKSEAAAGAKTRSQNLQDLLNSLKVKGANAKPVKHEVAVPVASAGVRGAEVKAGNRFAVLWPDEKISPLTALAMNLSNSAAQGKDKAAMGKQISDFQDNFPEHKDDPLLGDLKALLAGDAE